MTEQHLTALRRSYCRSIRAVDPRWQHNMARTAYQAAQRSRLSVSMQLAISALLGISVLLHPTSPAPCSPYVMRIGSLPQVWLPSAPEQLLCRQAFGDMGGP